MPHIFTPTALRAPNPSLCAVIIKLLFEKAACLQDKSIIQVCRKRHLFQLVPSSGEGQTERAFSVTVHKTND